MSIQQELNLPHGIDSPQHEAVLNIVLTGAMIAKESDRLLRPLRLTDAQFNILMLLRYQTKDGAINQTQLGDMLLVNRSNVTGLIDRLEQAGWVERTADPVDRRVKMVRLTTAGKRLLDKSEKVYFERIERLMAGLAPKQLRQLCSLLEQFRRQIRTTQ